MTRRRLLRRRVRKFLKWLVDARFSNSSLLSPRLVAGFFHLLPKFVFLVALLGESCPVKLFDSSPIDFTLLPSNDCIAETEFMARHGDSTWKTFGELTKDYLEGLKDYWAGRPRTAIEHVSKVLADFPEHPNQLQLYRLWIELLADEGESAALQTLGVHLESRAASDQDTHEYYFSLCGLVYFENEQFEAARLYAEALAESHENPYATELQDLVAYRIEKEQRTSSFWAKNTLIVDYLHASSMASSFLRHGESAAALSVLERAQRQFPGAPLVDRFRMHEALEKKRYVDAVRYAASLHAQYPGHPHYGLFTAYAMIKSDRMTEATSLLTKLVAVLGETDVDAVSLLGHCFKEIYVATGDEHSRERAGYYLNKAEALVEDSGMCADMVNFAFSAVRDRSFLKMSKHQQEERPPRIWMLKLSQQRFHELQTSDNEELRFLSHAVSADAAPGDLCFMVGEDYQKVGGVAQRWRIGAIYSVASEARWHPLDGSHNVMILLNKPAGSIPFEINFTDERRGKGGLSANSSPFKDRRGASRGVFELDASALDHIAEAIEEYRGMDQSMARMVDELSRIRRIS